MIPLAPPITLGRDEARAQAQQELAKPEYVDVGSWLSDWWRKLMDWLLDAPNKVGDIEASQTGPIVVAIVVAIVLVTIIVLAGPLRRDRRIHEQAMFADGDHTATELREDAIRLGDAGEWTQATIQRFRALVRALDERAIIDETTGMTAHEAVQRSNERLPSFAAALARSADVFDGLAYGRRTATRVHYEELSALDDAVQRAVALPVAVAAAPADDVPADGTRVTMTAQDGERP